MFNELFTPDLFPFTLALACLFGMLGLELVFALLGGTFLGAGADSIDGPEIDLAEPELGIDLGDMSAEIDSFELAEFEAEGVTSPATAGGSLDWLGLGRMPMAIWLASILMVFGLAGVSLQWLSEAVFGDTLSPWLVGIPAVLGALGFTRAFGAVFARLIPRTETQVLSERHLGRRKGVISQGTAARGRPAEVRVTDRYGNTHYLRAEPLRDNAQIAQGTEVVVLRHRYEDGYYLVSLSD